MECDTANDVRSLASAKAGSRTNGAGATVECGEAAQELPTVLVVDDEEGVRELVRRILRHVGYPVLCAAGGHEALALADGHTGAIGLLVSDMLMPDMDGQALADVLRAQRPDLRVLLMTGGPAIGDGALGKPFTIPALLDAVRCALSSPS